MNRIAWITAVAAFAAAQPVSAQPLDIGATAPNLDKISHWLSGKPVDAASMHGKQITVVEFWATWCPPCIESIPHLTELQHKYADKNVRLVAVTSPDPGNTLEIVKKFVKKMGDKMDYTVAFDESGVVTDAFMGAAGQEGIPTVFVIDRNGKLAWVGPPQLGLDQVVEELVAGRFDIAKAAKLAAVDKRIAAAERRGDWTAIIKATDEALAVAPDDVNRWMTKFFIYRQFLDRPAAAKEAALTAIKYARDKPDALVEIVGHLLDANDALGCNAAVLEALGYARNTSPSQTNLWMAGVWALVETGDVDAAIRLAKESVPAMESDPSALTHFAEMLLSFAGRERFADVALLAIDAAIAKEPAVPQHRLAKFRIYSEAKNDRDAALAAGRALIGNASNDTEFLNGFAWGLLTDPQTKGKYNDLALAAADAMSKAPGGDGWSSLDTLALAKFESGSVAEAIEMQKKAVENCPNEGMRIMLRESLARYQAARK